MDSQRYSRPNGTGEHSADEQSREQSRDSAFKGAKRSPLTKWKSWNSWAKVIKAVIGCPSECQKQRDFQGGLDFDEKGGGGRGGSKMQNLSGNTRFKVVKRGPFRAHFGQNRASLGAFVFILIESVLESGPKRPLGTGRPRGAGQPGPNGARGAIRGDSFWAICYY